MKSRATLDHETKSSYTGKFMWTVQGQSVTANVTIQVPDMPPPRKPDAPEVTRLATDPTTRLCR